MKAEHSKLDGYSATLPAMRPSPWLPIVVAPLPPPSPWEKPHGPIPRPAPLLNRLATDPLSFSPASIAPLAAAPTAPAISWLSELLPPACKAGKTLLLDASKLSSMAVPYLLSLGWGKNTSPRKWYKRPLPLMGNQPLIFILPCLSFQRPFSGT